MSKVVLVTGAGGYIGSVATYLFLQDGFKVIALDNFSTGFKQPLETLQEKFGKDKLKIFERDTTSDLSEVFEQEREISTVVHYAGSWSVNESMQNPKKYFENNVGGSLNLLSTMLKFGVKNLVFSSTCAVYGNSNDFIISENHPTNPTNPYGESKRMTEKIVEWYGKLLGLNYVTLRYFNVCGATHDGLIGDSKKPSVHLMQNAVRGALTLEPFYLTYSEVGTPDKSPIRDYVNVVDLNEAHLKAVNYLLEGGSSKIINIGTGSGNSVLELIKKVEEITGKILDKNKGESRKGEYSRAVASIKKAKEILNWEPKRSLEDSIKSLITWYKNHPNGWEE